MSDSKVLSQEEIDALLKAVPLAAPVATAEAAAPAVAASTPPTVKVVAAPPLSQRPPVPPLDLSALQQKPSVVQVPVAASGTVPAEMRQKIDSLEKKLEAATKNAEALALKVEKLTDALRKVAASVPKGTEQKMQLIWQGLQNTPDYNLYEKFVCKKCAAAGVAQLKARCGACGTEGWFGRKEARKP